MRCALVNTSNSTVENIIVADPLTDPAPVGFEIIGIPDDSPVEVGWLYINGEFIAPVPVAE